jgi:hypothetical protein
VWHGWSGCGKQHATAQLDVARVALPRIDAGLGGLRWTDVRAILEQELPYVEFWTFALVA